MTLLNDANVTPTPRSTAIAKLLQTSDEHDRMPQELPAAVLVALDRMLCIDPDTRISAADVVSLLAEPLSLLLTVSRLFIALWSTTSVCRLGLCAVCSLIQVHACVFNRASVSQSVNTTLLNVCPRFAPLALPALRLL